MDPERLRRLLEDVRSGATDIDQALQRLRTLPTDDIGHARLDTHRALRVGVGEVVYCESKTPQQVAEIFARLAEHHARVLGTRASPAMADAVASKLPTSHYDPVSRLLRADSATPAAPTPAAGSTATVAVVTGGTADLPVAEEAAQTCEFLGLPVARYYDVGVAGLHRLLAVREQIAAARVIICAAGMEGALPSVVAGLVASPVIAVPTSVGYGASFHGVAALLAMLSSCASGVSVVNIDNGFGAAIFAHAICAPRVPIAAGAVATDAATG